jgi:hypothetical protein
MIIIEERQQIFNQRVVSEQHSLLFDIAVWKNALTTGSVIRHHVEQFEVLATRILGNLASLYDDLHLDLHDPERKPDLDRSTFESAIASLLTAKWVQLRQVVLQRAPGNPYASELQGLDGIAEDAYEKLRLVLQDLCKLEDLSSSPPLVYLGPIARLLLFEEEGPYLIGTPFGAVNESDEFARELSRQTIPHEAADAIFEQIPEVLNELKFVTGTALADGEPTKKERAIHAVILNWLGEIVADMAGTALGGEEFARSAAMIMTMPEKLVGRTDDDHPTPLLRPFIHAWTLKNLSSEMASAINSQVHKISSVFLDRRCESLPALINVSLKEVHNELIRLVDLTWKTPLKTLDDHSLGEVFSAASKKEISRKPVTELAAWGEPVNGQDELFRLLGRIDPVNPLPGPELFVREICCDFLLIQKCCTGQTIT